MEGNNSLIYFHLPLTIKNSYDIIRNEENFQLSNVYHFFYVPKQNEFNSMNILLTIENEENDYPISIIYYIDYGIIPYSRNIEKNRIIIKNVTNLNIPNYSNFSKDNETYFIYFRFNATISKLKAKITYENIIYLEDQSYIILKPGINILKFIRDIDHYLKMTKINKNENSKSFYTIYKNEIIIEKKNINNTDNIIFIEEPSYKENIKLKIENEEEILLQVSSENFDDFSFISYDKNLDIEQIDNLLRIKFNTTNYNSKIEYQIALVNNTNDIDPISIHKIFQENNLIYRNIIYSSGIEPIETNFSLNDNDNITYGKNYTIIAFGKQLIDGSFNYLYMEPKTFLIIGPEKIKINEEDEINIEDTIKIEELTEIISNEPNMPSIEEEETDAKNNNSSNNNSFNNSENQIISKKDGDDSNTQTLAIVFSVLGGVIILGVAVGLIIYFKKKKNIVVNNNITSNSISNLKI